MADTQTQTDGKVREKAEQPEERYPPIPPQYWFESERHTIDTSDTDPNLEKSHIAINGYTEMKHFGHKMYMTKNAAKALAEAILKELNKE